MVRPDDKDIFDFSTQSNCGFLTGVENAIPCPTFGQLRTPSQLRKDKPFDILILGCAAAARKSEIGPKCIVC